MVGFGFEQELRKHGIARIAGIDEAGRGPLAGPVVAAAVIFPPEWFCVGASHARQNGIVGLAINSEVFGVNDSKKLSPQRREQLYAVIRRHALGIGVGIVSPSRIDEVNVLRASEEAMQQAVSSLSVSPEHILVDGPRPLGNMIPCTAIIDGDAKCFSIAAASIIAKVTRDRMMVEFDRQFPQYGFAKHKGYGTKEHFAALVQHGPCAIHRKTFRLAPKPVPLHGTRSRLDSSNRDGYSGKASCGHEYR